MKRKSTACHGKPHKRPRQDPSQSAPATLPPLPQSRHPVLQRLYPSLLTLRHYVLSRLPASSKNRLRKIAQLTADSELAQLLDCTLVGSILNLKANPADEYISEREKDIQCFSQELSTLNTGPTSRAALGRFSQSEAVDCVIWRLFHRSPLQKPAHLLCHGFQRGVLGPQQRLDGNAVQCTIPGFTLQFRNSYVDILKGQSWSQLHALLGQDGDAIMIDLLLDCGIFSQVEGSSTNYYQISGPPVSAVKARVEASASTRPNSQSGEIRQPSAITFVRSRMLYARAALNAKGGVRFGMRHIHVLNRLSDLQDQQQTVHIMRYIFPRQFGLHNVFTSKVDHRDTSMTFKDYTMREAEINQAFSREASRKESSPEQVLKTKSRVPPRLRGDAVMLVNKMRALNKKCPYVSLLRHYCPVEGFDLSVRPNSTKKPCQSMRNTSARSSRRKGTMSDNKNEPVKPICFTDWACPTAHVSAFCRAVIARVLPHGFWGEDQIEKVVLYWVDQFICLRRYESLTLHQVIQKIKISQIAWLRPPGQDTTANMAKTDSDKRLEIFVELVYWVFDSFLIPLIRTNFHVTESNVHRNRVFYFRHDIWRKLTEPALRELKSRMFAEVPLGHATAILASRQTGFSKIRLLPKHSGVRIIANLRRRQQWTRNGLTGLGRSINSVMTPAFSVITYEKSRQADRFGSSLFSVDDMFPRLTKLKQCLEETGPCTLYFAKVDVLSCFDTIPQQRLLAMVEILLSCEAYQTGKHVQISPLPRLQRLSGNPTSPQPIKRYIPHGCPAADAPSFSKLVQEQFLKQKANTVFVDTMAQSFETKDNLMALLREHVEQNMVKMGKKYYRQKAGIPQGSILSTILCNFFYAEFEREVLAFTQRRDSLLVRLLDDFCFITPDRQLAEQFVRMMHRPHPEYGISVKCEKSLTNFNVATEGGHRIAKEASDGKFPYCGVLIDTKTLEVSKRSEREQASRVSDALTVDLAKMPGQSFHRKALNGFKIQLKAMFIDPRLNSLERVLANLYQGFLEAAVRCFEYMRSLNKVRPTHPGLLIKTVESMAALGFVMMQRRTRSRAKQNVERVRSAVSRRQVQWLACKGFEAVFQRRQTQHGALLGWIGGQLAASRPQCSAERFLMERAMAQHAGRVGGCGAK